MKTEQNKGAVVDSTAERTEFNSLSNELAELDRQIQSEQKTPADLLKMEELANQRSAIESREHEHQKQMDMLSCQIDEMKRVQQALPAVIEERSRSIGRLECFTVCVTLNSLERLLKYDRATWSLEQWLKLAGAKISALNRSKRNQEQYLAELTVEKDNLSSQIWQLGKSSAVIEYRRQRAG